MKGVTFNKGIFNNEISKEDNSMLQRCMEGLKDEEEVEYQIYLIVENRVMYEVIVRNQEQYANFIIVWNMP